MAKIGTLTWLERTGGKLGWRDRLVFLAQAVVARARSRHRARATLRHVELDDILPPDSAITREAAALCQDGGEPYLFNHSIRSYFWARLLDDEKRWYDDEAVFTALLLHDLGLMERHRLRDGVQQCFTAVGAEMATGLAAKHGWPDRRATLAAQAISLHLNVVVDDDHGREAQLVRAGSGADVAGLGLSALRRDQIRTVVARHPRLDLKRKLIPALQIEASARPCCRIAFLQQKLHFCDLVARAPFDE